MASIDVKGHLLMKVGAEFEEVVLRSAKIGGQLSMIGSKFNGKLNMNSIEVKGTLFIRGEAEFEEVSLHSAKIGGQIDMAGSKFNGRLIMETIDVKKHLIMTDITTPFPVNLGYAVIGGSLILWGSNLNSLNLTGTHIGQELSLDLENKLLVKWAPESKITLRNTVVGALVDHPEAWPENLVLDGFTYAQLGGLGGDSEDDMDSRDVSWLKGWIEKDKSYSPQPYLQLAGVLAKEGHRGKASDILYHGKNRELSKSNGIDKLFLSLNKSFIGYGYRVYNAGIWALGFVIFGMIILWTTNSEIKEKINDNQNSLSYFVEIFFYSLDMILPIIKLADNHKVSTLPNEVRYYFYVHHMMGYVLGFFLIAGLSGLVAK